MRLRVIDMANVRTESQKIGKGYIYGCKVSVSGIVALAFFARRHSAVLCGVAGGGENLNLI